MKGETNEGSNLKFYLVLFINQIFSQFTLFESFNNKIDCLLWILLLLRFHKGECRVWKSHPLFLMRKLTLKFFCHRLLLIDIGQPLKICSRISRAEFSFSFEVKCCNVLLFHCLLAAFYFCRQNIELETLKHQWRQLISFINSAQLNAITEHASKSFARNV